MSQLGGSVTYRPWGSSCLPICAVCKYLISDTFCTPISVTFIPLRKSDLAEQNGIMKDMIDTKAAYLRCICSNKVFITS
jgi:hypothetical protein